MAQYATLKANIAEYIKENHVNDITGNLLQQQLLAIVNSLGVGYQYIGTATPSTNPGTPDQNVFYIASTAGTYANFGGIVLADGEIAILKWNGAWAKDSTGAASQESVNQLGQEVIYNDFLFGKKIFEYPNSGFVGDDGNIYSADSYCYSEKIPVKESDYLSVKANGTGGTSSVAFFDIFDNFISGVVGTGVLREFKAIVPTDASYALFTTKVEDKENSFYQSVFDNYQAETKEDISSQVASLAISIDKMKSFLYQGWMVDLNDGEIYTAGLYAMSPYCKVIPGKTVIAELSVPSGVVAAVAFYNNNLNFISGIAGNPSITEFNATVPSNAVYARFCTLIENINDSSVAYKGNALSEKYGKAIKSIKGFPAATAERAVLSAGNDGLNIHEFPQSLKKGHVLTFRADIEQGGFGNGFQIGFGYGETASAWLEINTEDIVMTSVARGGVVETQHHGITNFNTFVSISIYATNDGKALLYLWTLNESYGDFINEWGWDFNGLPHVLALENSEYLNCKLSVGNTDIKKAIWMFGDSYFNYWAGGYTYYFKQWSCQNFAIAARGGNSSTTAFEELQKMLTYGRPEYIVWEIAINDYNDFTTWRNTFDAVKELCDIYEVEMIGVIPPVGKSFDADGKANLIAMGNYIKNSGIRYIDIYKALGCNNNGEWYNDGENNDFQQSDGTHMSAYGAPYATQQFLIDFPELLQYNNVSK